MIVVRDIFQLKFGKARDAVALWREGLPLEQRAGGAKKVRMMTDVVGSYYTLVLESEYDSLADFERAGQAVSSNAEWRAWYQRFLPLAESGRREVFQVVE